MNCQVPRGLHIFYPRALELWTRVMYRIFSIQRRALIKRRPRLNAGWKPLLFKQTPGAFDRGPGVYLRSSYQVNIIVLAYELKAKCITLPQYWACIVYSFFFLHILIATYNSTHAVSYGVQLGEDPGKVYRTEWREKFESLSDRMKGKILLVLGGWVIINQLDKMAEEKRPS